MKAVNLMAKRTDEQVELQDKGQRAGVRSKGAVARPVKKAESRGKPARKSSESRLRVAAGIDMARQYLREVAYELRKVVWPSRKETLASTAVVLVVVMLCGIYLGFVDLILARFVRLLIG